MSVECLTVGIGCTENYISSEQRVLYKPDRSSAVLLYGSRQPETGDGDRAQLSSIRGGGLATRSACLFPRAFFTAFRQQQHPRPPIEGTTYVIDTTATISGSFVRLR
jgi:hypothetical protein